MKIEKMLMILLVWLFLCWQVLWETGMCVVSSIIMITTDMPRIEYDKFNAFERSVAKYGIALVDIHVSDHLKE